MTEPIVGPGRARRRAGRPRGCAPHRLEPRRGAGAARRGRDRSSTGAPVAKSHRLVTGSGGRGARGARRRAAPPSADADDRGRRALRRRRRDRRREAGRARRASRRGPRRRHARQRLARAVPGDRGGRRPAASRHRAPARPRHERPARRRARRARAYDALVAQLADARRRAPIRRARVGPARIAARRDRRADRPLGARAARAWRCASGQAGAHRVRGAEVVRDAGVLAARLPARDRAHAPDPRAPRRRSAIRSSATRPTAGRATTCRSTGRSCTRPGSRSTIRQPASSCRCDEPLPPELVRGARRPRAPSVNSSALSAGRHRVSGWPMRVRSTSSASVTCSSTRRVSSSTPTHTSCRTQCPSQWSGCSGSGSCGPSTAATISASVISLGRPGEHVAAADAPLRPHEPGALDRQQDLLEVGLGKVRALRDLLHRRRPLAAVQREREQRAGGVVAPRRHLHGPIVARDTHRGDARARLVRCDQWRPTPVRLSSSARLSTARRSRAWSRRCSGARDASWLPEPARDAPTRSCCWCSTVWAGSAVAGPREPDADARGDGRRADHHGRAVDDRDRAHVDRDRARARAARHRRLPDARRPARAQRVALDGARRRPPARSVRRPAPHRVPRARRSRS